MGRGRWWSEDAHTQSPLPGRPGGGDDLLRNEPLRKGTQLPRRRRAIANGPMRRRYRQFRTAVASCPPRSWERSRPASSSRSTASGSAESQPHHRQHPGGRGVGQIGQTTVKQPVPALRTGRERKRAIPPRRPKIGAKSTKHAAACDLCPRCAAGPSYGSTATASRSNVDERPDRQGSAAIHVVARYGRDRIYRGSNLPDLAGAEARCV
jgi:hypothetical protein